MHDRSLRWIVILLLTACAHRAEPALSADEHERRAGDEEAIADQCSVELPPDEVCWSDLEAPSVADRASADEHRRRAAEHRAAAAALRDAESSACVGLADTDRDMSPFAHRADIASVAPLERDEIAGRSTVHRRVGATIVFRARRGLTAAWLQRVLDCHLARNAAMGWSDTGMEYCPLAIEGAHATAREVRAGFAVDVSSDDATTAAEILRRAEALTHP